MKIIVAILLAVAIFIGFAIKVAEFGTHILLGYAISVLVITKGVRDQLVSHDTQENLTNLRLNIALVVGQGLAIGLIVGCIAYMVFKAAEDRRYTRVNRG